MPYADVTWGLIDITAPVAQLFLEKLIRTNNRHAGKYIHH